MLTFSNRVTFINNKTEFYPFDNIHVILLVPENNASCFTGSVLNRMRSGNAKNLEHGILVKVASVNSRSALRSNQSHILLRVRVNNFQDKKG